MIWINIGRFVILIVVQLLLLNNINLGGLVNPYLFVLFILKLPFSTPRYLLLLSAFLMGLLLDIFSNSPGLNASTCLLVAFTRPYIIGLVTSKRSFDTGIQPSVKDMGLGWYLSYSVILVSIHHFAFFFIEMFRFQGFGFTLFRAMLSIAFTMLLLFLTEYLFFRPKA
jgi:rod shape-determining protein MreD